MLLGGLLFVLFIVAAPSLDEGLDNEHFLLHFF